MLAKIDREKTTFFSSVSHEFRTPLILILGPVEDALADTQQPLPLQQRQRLELIQRSGIRLLKLVNSLLDFSRIEANRMNVIYEPTNISQLTTGLVSVFRSVIEKAELQLIVDISPFEDAVYIDREMWEKIIFNLLSNALKFTLQGSIQVSLKKQEDCIELIIQDTGIGIPNSELPRIFERFHRVRNAKGRTYEGSGIGLSLTQELVKLHGGVIRVTSQEGEGSKVIVTIPLGYAHLPADKIGKKQNEYEPNKIGEAFVAEALAWLPNQEKKELIHRQHTRPDFIPFGYKVSKILFADDNADMRFYVENLLSPYWLVESVADGEAALQSALKQPPDLILTDVMMPKMDGFALLKALRSLSQTQTIPVLFCSARAGEEAIIEGLECGPNDYIVKPFSAKDLIARIEAQLKITDIRKAAFQREQELQLMRLQEAEDNRQRQIEYIDTICHEIRNPLQGIFGGISFLQDCVYSLSNLFSEENKNLNLQNAQKIGVLLHKINKQIEIFTQCASQQKLIVDDVLDLSKLECNKVELNPAIFNPNAIIQTAVDTFKAQADAKHVQITTEVAPEADQLLEADANRFSQILMNLLSNAVKFTHKGAISIKADLQALSDIQTKLYITIEDTGIGMSPDTIARLFQRFSQASRGTPAEYGGSGLGLLISKRLTEIMGGELKVSSEKWKGTCFSFSIDCLKPTAEKLAKAASKQTIAKAHEQTIASLDFSDLTILIVEDNRFNQKVLKRFLDDKKCKSQIAENGREALAKFEQFTFNLIFMDIEMPVMRGLEATIEIRKKEQALGSHVPIIGLSGNARAKQIDIAREAGMDDYIAKPYHKQEIYQAISQYARPTSITLSTAEIPHPKSKSMDKALFQPAISQLKADLEWSLQQHYPFKATQIDDKITIELLAAQTSLTQHACKLILKELQETIKSQEGLWTIKQSLLSQENLTFITRTVEQSQRLKTFLMEAGFAYAFMASPKQEGGESIASTLFYK